jgi:hypothetical protein
MIVLKPTTYIKRSRSDLTTLFFDGVPTGLDFVMRGAICWPDTAELGPVDGFALIGGWSVQAKQVIVFEEHAFNTVSHWLDSRGRLLRLGAREIFNIGWARYGCRLFFSAQDELLHQRFIRQVYEDPLINPHPDFIRIPYTEEVMGTVLEEAADRGSVKADVDSQLRGYFEDKQSQPNLVRDPPAVRALKFLVGGFEYTPYQERRAA